MICEKINVKGEGMYLIGFVEVEKVYCIKIVELYVCVKVCIIEIIKYENGKLIIEIKMIDMIVGCVMLW